MQQHHFAAPIGAVWNCRGSGWGVRGPTVKSPARQPGLTEPTGDAVYHQQTLSIDQEVKREGGQSAPKYLDVPKCRSGVVAAHRTQVRNDPNDRLGRHIPTQRPRPGRRQRMIADRNREWTAEEMNRAVAVIHSRLGVP